ncbi:hypothetical protein [Actimicrobium antarcticum]|uniref:Uncharacterized protein n=1 Tax=Actimicrobium antarcticum TaxID=1051899 RepID=A0ABP7TRQ2_9BURK
MKNPFASLAPADVAGTNQRQAPRAHAFGKPAHHVAPFMAAAYQNFTLIAPLMFVAAVVLSILAANQSAAFITAVTRDIKSSEANKIAPLLDKKPLGPADYQSVANVMAKNNAAVTISLPVNRSSVQISIKDAALLPEFMYALATLQSFRQGVAWNASRICLAKCDGGVAASADITGYTQAISFSGLSAR